MSELERRIAALSDEIRNYPRPIARCDEQLTALIEERSALLRLLEGKERSPVRGCTPEGIWANDGGSIA